MLFQNQLDLRSAPKQKENCSCNYVPLKCSISLCAGFFSVLGGLARWLHVGGGAEARPDLREKNTNRWRFDASRIYQKQGYI